MTVLFLVTRMLNILIVLTHNSFLKNIRSTIKFVVSEIQAHHFIVLFFAYISFFIQILNFWFSFRFSIHFDDFQIINEKSFKFNGTFDVEFHFILCTKIEFTTPCNSFDLKSSQLSIVCIFDAPSTQSLDKPIDWIKIINKWVN